MKPSHSLSSILGACFLLAIGLYILPISSSFAAVPQLINYQGKLTKVSGAPLDTTISMVFTIYADSNGITSKWSESQSSVKVEKGVFNVLLGSVNAIPDSVFDGSTRYLGVAVGGDPEITPRKAIVSVAYAFHAFTADSALNVAEAGMVSVDGVSNPGGDVDLISQNAIYITPDDGANTITIGEDHSLKTNNPHLTTAAQTGALVSVDGVSNAGGNVDFIAGSNMTITPNDGANTITFSASGADNDWTFRVTDTADTTLITGGAWGIARYGNVLHGNKDSTHVNLGVACTTGASGQNYKYCTVGGGFYNTASGWDATVGGGRYNTASSWFATVGGGYDNTASLDYATVGGGYLNTASGLVANVGGGYGNTASNQYATVGGGESDTASNFHTTVGGGYRNTASGLRATIGGGYQNRASGDVSTVAGGSYNIASGINAIIGGGNNNTASATNATVGGGGYNTASATSATVGGGNNNIVSGDYSVIPGGYYDTLTASGDYSMIFGYGVYVNTSYRVAFFDGTYSGGLGINRDDRDGGISYPIHVGTNTGNGNGAYLSAGGTWTDVSSREVKENFQKLDGSGILDKLQAMDICRWQYKGTDEHHIGPVAEDFYSAFGIGTDDKHLASSDVSGVALRAIQELLLKLEAQQKKIESLEKKIANLER